MKRRTASLLKRMPHCAFILLSTLALILFTGGLQHANAQSESGSAAIEGTVLDTNGGTVAGAAITVRNEDTGLQRVTTTNSGGHFSVPVLPVGRYSVKTEAKGFGT